ncbi:MAG TPA: PTS glucose transporter subunit IIA [Micromonosporaceae bacterium]|nr:PTS glucose transporter subunit IIA [Micromonosporaceae bacterium]
MSLTVVAPVTGRIVRLADVPDPVFSAALVGPGVAIDPMVDGRSQAVSPVDGTIAKLHPHAYVVTTADGAGVLVHLGIDTVQLAGEGFELLAEENASIGAGEPIVAWDPAAVQAGGRSPICPVVALDAPAEALSGLLEGGEVAAGDALFTWDR